MGQSIALFLAFADNLVNQGRHLPYHGGGYSLLWMAVVVAPETLTSLQFRDGARRFSPTRQTLFELSAKAP